MRGTARKVTEWDLTGNATAMTSTFALAALLSLVAWGSRAEEPTLRIEPDAVTLSSYAATARIAVLLNEKPVPISEINKKIFIGVENKDYSRMFVVKKSEKEPGVIELRARPGSAEVGSYDLRISVAGQQATTTVFLTLDELPGMLENQAAATGKTVEELGKERGLVTNSPHEDLDVILPEAFPEGAVMTIALDKNEKRHYTWSVNGEIVLEGLGESTLRLPVTEPDVYAVGVVEEEDGVERAKWEGQFRGVEMAPLEWTVTAKRPSGLAGPEGYKHYEWRVDGKLVGEKRVFSHMFDAAGEHVVECKAIEPNDDPDRVFLRIVWKTTVVTRPRGK